MPNYLSTLTSRNRDMGGWWLLGMVESSLDGISIDLLGNPPLPETFLKKFEHDAIQLFRCQVEKHDLSISMFSKVVLCCSRGKPSQQEFGRISREGHDFIFDLTVITGDGREVNKSSMVFISPHDPELELRSVRLRDGIIDRNL